jgi:3-oxosteroid 1-dehydrogenase
MGRKYPGAGASIGASFVFSYIAMKHTAAQAIQSDAIAQKGMTQQ